MPLYQCCISVLYVRWQLTRDDDDDTGRRLENDRSVAAATKQNSIRSHRRMCASGGKTQSQATRVFSSECLASIGDGTGSAAAAAAGAARPPYLGCGYWLLACRSTAAIRPALKACATAAVALRGLRDQTATAMPLLLLLLLLGRWRTVSISASTARGLVPRTLLLAATRATGRQPAQNQKSYVCSAPQTSNVKSPAATVAVYSGEKAQPG